MSDLLTIFLSYLSYFIYSFDDVNKMYDHIPYVDAQPGIISK